MPSNEGKWSPFLLMLGSLTSLTAIGLQLYVTINAREVSLLNTFIRFFSYFTILTNTIVAIYFTSRWLFPSSTIGSFFRKFTTTTAIMVYILVVGIIYNILLRGIWPVSGLGKIADELLHSFVPVYFMIYWFFFTERTKLNWKNAVSWIWYPLLYFVYTLIRGTITNTYPYPFVNVTKLGYQQVILNCVGVGLLFYLLSILAIAISRNYMKE